MAGSLGNGDGSGPVLVGSPNPPKKTTPSSWPSARWPVRLVVCRSRFGSMKREANMFQMILKMRTC